MPNAPLPDGFLDERDERSGQTFGASLGTQTAPAELPSAGRVSLAFLAPLALTPSLGESLYQADRHRHWGINE